jgi:hypothetical protein
MHGGGGGGGAVQVPCYGVDSVGTEGVYVRTPMHSLETTRVHRMCESSARLKSAAVGSQLRPQVSSNPARRRSHWQSVRGGRAGLALYGGCETSKDVMLLPIAGHPALDAEAARMMNLHAAMSVMRPAASAHRPCRLYR